MRNLTFCLSATIATATFVYSARADLIAYEGFDYVPGTVEAAAGNGGTGWTGNWSNPITVASGSLTQGGLQQTGGKAIGTIGSHYDASRPIGSINSGSLWFSYLYTSAPSSTTKWGLINNNYDRPIQLYVDPWESTVHTVGNLAPANIGVRDQQYFVVGRIDFDAGTTPGNEAIRLWITDAPASPPATQPLDSEADYADLNTANIGTLIRVEINISNPASAIDEIRLGTTYADVVPVPEPAAAVLAIASLAGLQLRRRRA